MTHHITHLGRRYRLFTRSTEPGASLYLYFEERGERILKSTGYADKAGATKWVRAFLDARRDKNNAAMDALLCRNGTVETSTVGTALNWFEANRALSIGDASRRNYCNCFRWVLRKATGKDDVDALRLGAVLNKNTLLEWQQVIALEARAADTQERAGQIKRSANSMLNQARSIFSLLTVEQMKRGGLIMPDLGEFLTACKLVKFPDCSKDDYRPPTDDVIAATLHDWRSLVELLHLEPQRNLYAAIWLALSTGMRLGEIAQARWDWITEADGAPLILGRGDFKNGTGTLRIRPIDPFWNEGLRHLSTINSQPSTILVGTATETGIDTFRRVSELMRAAGWRTEKATHALRALSGSWVAARFGIFEAQQWLRHSSVTTTEKHYAVLLRDKTFKPQAIEWATS